MHPSHFSSKSKTSPFDLIKACEQQGWTFLYLGADHDVWAAGESLGVAGENRISFCKRDIGKTFDHLSETTARYRRGRSGQSKSSSRQDAAESKKGN